MTSRIPAALSALAVFLIGAFVLAPGPLSGDLPGGLGASLRQSFEEYWRAGQRGHLQTVVDYWFRYHLFKGAIAALLLAVLIVLGVLITRRFLHSGGPLRAVAGVAVGLLGLVALAAVMANLQGAIAPLASLFPMLPADVLAQIAPQLAAGAHPPAAVAVMVDDFALYHVAMAVIATVLALTFVAATVLAGRRFVRAERADRRSRVAIGSFAAVAALLSMVMVVLAMANTTVAADPQPAFQAFVGGGW
ncbi:hypothetical protein Acy02nite_00670 [Actinoplanes cyaneus]|jgi:hypothetical protein|uniref:Tat (Twin-arginine translocation) pathway signal sequence n=1 Tax=Actinoplanes cyaneus TaxID=52696 RepID=A0A919ID52_9ACTN|nr:hypothetical protein [Actinoplanes cyaneus]MCW2142638.1 hypothetical protein [Actinoplanes cyaneus]GID62186.1 hypothetical protein Acy02nite_00670 [Actinoplanes cyaneus]